MPNNEGLSVVGRVTVLDWHTEVNSGESAAVIAQALKKHRVVMMRGHGSFAIGQLLEEAYSLTTALEGSC